MIGIENHAEKMETTETVSCTLRDAQGNFTTGEESLVREHFIEISVNGRLIARLSCTPEHLSELVLGRLYTERVIEGPGDVERIFICGRGNIAEVTLSGEMEFVRWEEPEPTCCTGNRQFFVGKDAGERKILPETVIDPKEVFRLAKYFQKDTSLHKSTKGAHSCYIRYPDGTIECYEDISRHNALDKAVGAMLLKGASPEDCMLFVSGRIAVDMAEKTISAGIPVLISKASPTNEALRLANEYNLTIIGRAWPDSFSAYNKGCSRHCNRS